jgi:hypothetical protein
MYQINHVSAAALTTVTSYYNFTSFYIKHCRRARKSIHTYVSYCNQCQYLPLMTCLIYSNKIKKKYHAVGTVHESTRKIVERDKIDTTNTHIYDLSMFWLETGISMQSVGVQLIVWG